MASKDPFGVFHPTIPIGASAPEIEAQRPAMQVGFTVETPGPCKVMWFKAEQLLHAMKLASNTGSLLIPLEDGSVVLVGAWSGFKASSIPVQSNG